MLMLHLEKFKYSLYGISEEINTLVNFNPNRIDLAVTTVDDEGKTVTCVVFAIKNHMENVESRHYIASVKKGNE